MRGLAWKGAKPDATAAMMWALASVLGSALVLRLGLGLVLVFLLPQTQTQTQTFDSNSNNGPNPKFRHGRCGHHAWWPLHDR